MDDEVRRQYRRCLCVLRDRDLQARKPLEHHLLLTQEVTKLACHTVPEGESGGCPLLEELSNVALAADAMNRAVDTLDNPEGREEGGFDRAVEAARMTEGFKQDTERVWLMHAGGLAALFANQEKFCQSDWSDVKRVFTDPRLAESIEPCARRLKEIMLAFNSE